MWNKKQLTPKQSETFLQYSRQISANKFGDLI